MLAIVGMTLGIAVAAMDRRAPAAALDGAALTVRAVLASARSVAVAEGRPVVFAGAARGYQLDGRYHPLADAGADLRIDILDRTRISFFASGASSGGRVILTTAAIRREIEVETVTGRAFLLQ